MKMKENKKLLSLVLAILLIISASSMVMQASGEAEKEIMLVSYEDETDLNRIQYSVKDVIEIYPNRVLVSISESERDELLMRGFSVREIPNRTVLTVKEYTFDIHEGFPDFPPELMVEEYEPGTRGIHLVHMLGPIHSSWRQSLLDMGVEIINYVPNYAYEVRMTPELTQEVEDLYFVDWIGIYQPGFKMARYIEPGLISVSLLPGLERSTLNSIGEKATILSQGDNPFGSTMLLQVDDMETLIELAHLNDVYFMDNYVEPKLHDEMATQIIGGGCWIMDDDDDPWTPYRAHGVRGGSHVNQYLGLSGWNVLIAIADTGVGDGTIGNAGHSDFTYRVVSGYSWLPDDPYNWADGHGHGTHCAGSAAGDTWAGTRTTMDFAPYYAAQGLAYESNIFPAKIFTDGADFLPSTYYEIVEIPKQLMPELYVHSNSWGAATYGAYSQSSSQFDMAVRDGNNQTPENEPVVITTSAGNEGPGYNSIGAPATGKNVIAVGATHNFNPDASVFNPDMIIGFSSRGWTNDNRVKPDVVAPGHGIYSTMPDGDYWTMSGTSMSNPAVAGAVALVVEWYASIYGVRPSPAMVKAMLINTAYDLCDDGGNTGPIPNRDEGWGMVFLPALMDSPGDFIAIDETELIETGEVHNYAVIHDDDLEPLKISLVWTDKYALAGDEWTLKNNLDLEVVAPDGETYYRGNAFPVDEEGNSRRSFTAPNTDSMPIFDTNGDGWDDVNNVLNVYIPADEVQRGVYTVRVIGTNVPEDANNDGDANQDYALYMNNAVYSEGRPDIELTYPTGGETWNYNDEVEIAWTTTITDNPIENIDLLFTLDEGKTWHDIALALPDTGSYDWTVIDQPANTIRIRAIVNDDEGLSRVHTSETFNIIGTPPAAPGNLDVQHHIGPTTRVVDDFQDGDYTLDPTWTVFRGDWTVDGEEGYYWLEGDGSISTPYPHAYGRWEWDFQFARTDIVGGRFQVMRFYFVMDNTLNPGDGSLNGYYVILTGDLEGDYGKEAQFNLWRVDNGNPVEPPMVRAQWDANTEWNTLAIEREDDGSFWLYLNDNLVGHAQCNIYDNTVGIGFRNEATSKEDWHRVGEIRTIHDLEGFDHNLITWGHSPDDGAGRNSVDHYDIERSFTGIDNWYNVGTVTADGSADYSYTDRYAGTYDNVAWWYRVRAVDLHGLYDDTPMPPVQEPVITDVSVSIVSPSDGDMFNRDSLSVNWISTGDIDFYHLTLNHNPPIYKLEQNHNLINLPNGANTITVEAFGSGGEYVSDTVTIIIDKIPPVLEITSESGGMTFVQTFVIEGVTEPTAMVDIDGVFVDVNETTGEFDYSTSLVDGLNVFLVTARDQAGNRATATVYALYMPDIPILYGEISNLQSQIDGLVSDIGAINTEITAIKGDISDLNDDVFYMQLDMVALWEELGEVIDDIEAFRGEMEDALADIDSAIGSLETEIDRLEDIINGLNADLNTLDARLDAELAALEQAIAENNTALIDEINDRIAVINADIQELENNITAIQAEIDESLDEIRDEIQAARYEIDQVESALNTFVAEQKNLDDQQDSDISTARNMALVGIFMAIIALILVAMYAVMSKGSSGSGGSYNEDESFDEESLEEEAYEDTLLDEDY